MWSHWLSGLNRHLISFIHVIRGNREVSWWVSARKIDNIDKALDSTDAEYCKVVKYWVVVQWTETMSSHSFLHRDSEEDNDTCHYEAEDREQVEHNMVMLSPKVGVMVHAVEHQYHTEMFHCVKGACPLKLYLEVWIQAEGDNQYFERDEEHMSNSVESQAEEEQESEYLFNSDRFRRRNGRWLRHNGLGIIVGVILHLHGEEINLRIELRYKRCL